VPLHTRMRVIDRDLIRGGHYGQRSCEPRKQAEHMAATDPGCYVKILLANSELSGHVERAVECLLSGGGLNRSVQHRL